MAKYRLLFKESVSKDLRGIPREDVKRILERIEGLADNPRPHGAKKLSGEEKYRLRQGIYRILYTIDDTVVVIIIVKVGNRRDVYR
jgi:mRNA interferase RelE/StbE